MNFIEWVVLSQRMPCEEEKQDEKRKPEKPCAKDVAVR